VRRPRAEKTVGQCAEKETKPLEKDRSRRRRRRSYRRRIEAAGEEDEATEEGLKSPEKD